MIEHTGHDDNRFRQHCFRDQLEDEKEEVSY